MASPGAVVPSRPKRTFSSPWHSPKGCGEQPSGCELLLGEGERAVEGRQRRVDRRQRPVHHVTWLLQQPLALSEQQLALLDNRRQTCPRDAPRGGWRGEHGRPRPPGWEGDDRRGQPPRVRHHFIHAGLCGARGKVKRSRGGCAGSFGGRGRARELREKENVVVDRGGSGVGTKQRRGSARRQSVGRDRRRGREASALCGERGGRVFAEAPEEPKNFGAVGGGGAQLGGRGLGGWECTAHIRRAHRSSPDEARVQAGERGDAAKPRSGIRKVRLDSAADAQGQPARGG
eukprot:scaffold6012_cov106-Isochrysis_galbana.AAC.12